MISAISSGSATLFKSVCFAILFIWLFDLSLVILDLVKPGETALTLTLGAKDLARDEVSVLSAPLLTAYGMLVPLFPFDDIEVTLTIAPKFFLNTVLKI